MTASPTPFKGLRAIALFKAVRSLIVLLVGVWLCGMKGHDVHVMVHGAADYLNLNPDAGFIQASLDKGMQYLVDRSSQVSDANILLVIGWAFGYGLLHGAESYGLWYGLAWAEWFTLSSGGIYIPLELISMWHGITWFNFGAFLLSLVITSYVGWMLYHSSRRRKALRQHA
ncbi:MAG: hypothetical protein JWO94_3081 [Verrucomicrobiaceae bacterium]|nr:hypothetical protein [Verrucomicrobiaceae bacterium]